MLYINTGIIEEDNLVIEFHSAEKSSSFKAKSLEKIQLRNSNFGFIES